MATFLEYDLDTGAPHFRAIARQHRNANYTFDKVVDEAVDNIGKKAKRIAICTHVNQLGKLEWIRVSDDYVKGFEDIHQRGSKNPFNMGHIRDGQYLDEETSEFGVGFKAGAISAGDVLKVWTKVDGEYYLVILEFLKMEQEDDVNKSYNPVIKKISEGEYAAVHPFNQGSTIEISQVRSQIYPVTTQEDITEFLRKNISNKYSLFIKAGLSVSVNGAPVEPEYDWFEDEKCKLFTVVKRIFCMVHPDTGHREIFVLRKSEKSTPTYKKYDPSTKKHVQSTKDHLHELRLNGYVYSDVDTSNPNHKNDPYAIKLESTMTFYSDLFHGNGDEEDGDLPFDRVEIVKAGRKYGNLIMSRHVNGAQNYTTHRLSFQSKKLGKELGITFNKDISMQLQNDLTCSIRDSVKDSCKEFNSDTSTKKNRDLCDKAIEAGLIDLLTCNEKILSNYHRKRREEIEAEKKALETVSSVSDDSSQEDEDEDEDDDEESVEQQIEFVIEPEVYTASNASAATESACTAAQLASPPVILDNVDEVAVEDEVAFVEEDVIPPATIEDPIPYPVGPSEHARITVETGLNVLELWKDSNQNLSTFEEVVEGMIKRYQDRSPGDQIDDLLQFMSFENKYRALIHIIKRRYHCDHDTKDMLGGIELHRVYKEKFP
jgi:hypothetical protein